MSPAFVVLCLLLATAQGAAAATINRCTVNGRTVYQQTACASDQQAGVVEAPAPPASAPVRNVPKAAPAVAAASAVPLAGAAGIGPVTGGALEAEAALCLDYLKPLLRDPASASVSDPAREGRVLKLKVNARDSRGRMQQRDAACELVSGRVDDGWTQIQLKRLGWLQSKPIVLGDSRDAQRQRRALDGDIEAEQKPR